MSSSQPFRVELLLDPTNLLVSHCRFSIWGTFPLFSLNYRIFPTISTPQKRENILILFSLFPLYTIRYDLISRNSKLSLLIQVRDYWLTKRWIPLGHGFYLFTKFEVEPSSSTNPCFLHAFIFFPYASSCVQKSNELWLMWAG